MDSKQLALIKEVQSLNTMQLHQKNKDYLLDVIKAYTQVSGLDIKTFMADMKEEISNTLSQLKAEIVSNGEEVSQLKIDLAKANARIEKLESNQNKSNTSENVNIKQDLELLEKKMRQRNVIITNLVENTEPVSDRMELKNLGKFLNIDLDSSVVSYRRLGKKHDDQPRPLLLELKSETCKFEFFTKAKDLRKEAKYSKIFIGPDLTPWEQKESKRLRDRLKNEKTKPEHANKNIFIKSNKLFINDTVVDKIQPKDF